MTIFTRKHKDSYKFKGKKRYIKDMGINGTFKKIASDQIIKIKSWSISKSSIKQQEKLNGCSNEGQFRKRIPSSHSNPNLLQSDIQRSAVTCVRRSVSLRDNDVGSKPCNSPLYRQMKLDPLHCFQELDRKRTCDRGAFTNERVEAKVTQMMRSSKSNLNLHLTMIGANLLSPEAARELLGI